MWARAVEDCQHGSRAPKRRGSTAAHFSGEATYEFSGLDGVWGPLFWFFMGIGLKL